jgi:hypothetical protein
MPKARLTRAGHDSSQIEVYGPEGHTEVPPTLGVHTPWARHPSLTGTGQIASNFGPKTEPKSLALTSRLEPWKERYRVGEHHRKRNRYTAGNCAKSAASAGT